MLDLYEQENSEALARAPRTSVPEVGAFDGFIRGTAMGAVRQLAVRGFARPLQMVGSLGAIAYDRTVENAQGRDPFTGGTSAQDKYFQTTDEWIQSALDRWTPKPYEVGVAGEIAGALLGLLPLAIASPPTAVAGFQLDTAAELARKGVGDWRAQAVGAAQGAGLGVGIWMPFLGSNLWQRMLVGGAGANVAQGVIMRGAAEEILRGHPAAKDFEALNLQDITLDTLLGLAFGAAAHYVPSWRAQSNEASARFRVWAQNITPQEVAALSALRQAQHANQDSLPGKPATPADLDTHVERLKAAVEQLERGEERVQVQGIGRPTPEAPVEPAAVLEAGTPDPAEGAPARAVEAEEAARAAVEETRETQPSFEPDPARLAEMQARAEELVAEGRRILTAERLPPVDDTPAAPKAGEPARSPFLPDGVENLPAPQQAKRIAEKIEERLVQLGKEPEKAKADAAIWAGRMRAVAARYGISPTDWIARHGLEIERGETARPGAMEQAEAQRAVTRTPEFKAWFGDSKVVDKAGNPLVVYHGTGADITAFDPERTGAASDGGYFGKGVYFAAEPETAAAYGKAVYPVYLSMKNPYYWKMPLSAKLRETFSTFGFGKAVDAIAGRPVPADYGANLYGVVNMNRTLPPDIHAAVMARAGVSPEELRANTPMGRHARGVPQDFSGTDSNAMMQRFADHIRAELESRGYDGIVADNPKANKTYREFVAFRPEQIKSAIGNRGTFDPNDPNILRQDAPKPILERNPTGQPELIAQDVALAKTVHFETRDGREITESLIVNPETGEGVGRVTLAWNGDKVEQLLWINTVEDQRGKGLAEASVRAILEHNGEGNPVHIAHIVRKARGFWEKMGAEIFDSETGEDGTATLETYRTARADRARARAGEGTAAGADPRGTGTAEGAARQAPAAGEVNPTTLEQRPGPLWVSELSRQLETAKMNAAPAKGWKDFLRGLKGVKAAELEQTNINEWLDTQTGRVTKEQVTEYLRGSQVKVVDKVLGDDGKSEGDREIADLQGQLQERGYQVDTDGDMEVFGVTRSSDGVSFSDSEAADPDYSRPLSELPPEDAQLVERLGEMLEMRGDPYGALDSDTTKFGQYVLPGAKEGSYRELFVTMPDYKKNDVRAPADIKPMTLEEMEAQGFKVTQNEYSRFTGQTSYRIERNGEMEGMRSGMMGQYSDEAILRQFAQERAQRDKHDDHIERTTQPTWTDGHQPYDDIKNPIVRLRMNVRTNEKGEEGLFLEEVQQPTKEQLKKMPDWAKDPKFYIPVALKRAIMYAAEHDLKWVAWTTGEQQVSRYTNALRKAVDAIEWTKTPEGVQIVGYKGKKAEPFVKPEQITELPEGWGVIYDRSRPEGHQYGVTPAGQTHARFYDDRAYRDEATAIKETIKSLNALANAKARQEAERNDRKKVVDTTEREDALSDAIGKAMADRILNDPAQSGTIEGENIKVDSTWPATLYNKMLPNYAKDILKKLGGGKVGEVAIDVQGRPESGTGLETQYRYEGPELPFMRVDSIARRPGLPAAIERQLDDIAKAIEQGSTTADAVLEHGSITAAEVLGGKLTPLEQVMAKQPAIDITPAMKERALQGMPLFQKAKGQIEFSLGRTLLELFKTADASTFQHESSHLFLQDIRDIAMGENAPQQAMEDWAVIVKWLGIEGGEITRAQHEQFARGWERYLAKGEAPSQALREVFKQFKQWLLAIYRDIRNLEVEITPEVKALFDRMLATDEELAAGRTTETEGPPAQRSASSEPPPPPGEGGAAAEPARPEAAPQGPKERQMTVKQLREATKAGPFNLRRAEARAELERRTAKGEAAFDRDVPEMSETQLRKVIDGGRKYRKDLKEQALVELKARTDREANLQTDLQDPQIRTTLEALAGSAGWAQVGGKYDASRAREAGQTGETGVVAFTEWIPKAEWWTRRPDGMNEQATQEAVRKALAGEPLKAAERRMVAFLVEEARTELKAFDAIDEVEAGAMAEDWAALSRDEESLSREEGDVTRRDIVDSDLVARASELAEGRVERAAQQFENDDTAFMAEIRRILDEHAQDQEAPRRSEESQRAQAGEGEADALVRAYNDAQREAERTADRDAAEPDRALEAPEQTEGGATATDGALRRAAEDMVDSNPDRLIRVGTKPDGTPDLVSAKQYLEDARAAAAQAREDAGLFEIAATCMLGRE